MTFTVNGSNGLTFPNSSSQSSAGVVLQVVNATYNSQASSSSSTYSDTGLTASITPKFATSKILVTAHLCGLDKTGSNTQNAIGLKLVRNSTDLIEFGRYINYTNSTAESGSGSGSTTYLDSPATTSSTTYKVQFKAEANAGTVWAQNSGSTSTITLMEIAG